MNVQVATLPHQYSSTAGIHTLRIYNFLYYNIYSPIQDVNYHILSHSLKAQTVEDIQNYTSVESTSYNNKIKTKMDIIYFAETRKTPLVCMLVRS
jgi:hypothetical protein